MKEDLLETEKEGSVYPASTIIVSSLLGGLLAGGIMMYQNFKTFGDQKKANRTIALVLLTFIALLATAFIPAMDKIPNIAYTAITTLAIVFLVKKYQEAQIKQHINEGGKVYSVGRAVVICIIAVAIVLAFFLGIFMLQDTSFQQ